MSARGAITHIVKRNGSLVRYNRERIYAAILKAATASGHPDPALAEAMADQVEQALVATYAGNAMPSVEDIQDVVENVLMDHRHTAIARNYIIYRHQHAMVRATRSRVFDVIDNVPYRTLYEVLRWNLEHGCESVDALNRTIETGRFPELVRAADARFDEEVARAAGSLLEHHPGARLVLVAGPSSSGKTTTTMKLGEHLRNAGIGFRAMTVDHYFFNLEQHPVDEFGDYDYETPDALDMALIHEHLLRLLDGKTIRTPHYDFKTGRRTLDVHPLSLAPDEMLLIDSLHGLCDRMTGPIPAALIFRLYIEALGQLRTADGTFMRWADNRLLRRMSRDRDHRNLQPTETLAHWHYVRRSELEHIIPFIKHSDAIINSALPYELPILKHRLFDTITAAIHRFRDDPRRLDAHIRANRVHDLLAPLHTWEDDRCVPANSLLREFIGGSGDPH